MEIQPLATRPATVAGMTREQQAVPRGYSQAPGFPIVATLLIRLALFAACATALYLGGYLPARDGRTLLDWAFLIENTARAANDGHVFMAYSPASPPELIRLNEYAGGHTDPGLAMLVSLTSVTGRALFGNGFTVSVDTIYDCLLAFYLVTALLFVSPAVPLPIAVGGVVALGLGIAVGGPPGWSAFTISRWSATYAALVAGMLAATAPLPKRGFWALSVVVGLSVLISYAQFIRHEAAVTAYTTAVALLLTALTVGLLSHRLLRGQSLLLQASLTLCRRLALTGLILAGITWAGPQVVRGMYAAAWGTPYSETRVALHGDGHSLYLSLGWIPNPYNISWRDNVGLIHSKLVSPSTRLDGDYIDVLRREWLRIVLESPWLPVENVVAKLDPFWVTASRLPLSSRLIPLVPVVLLGVLLLGLARRMSSVLLIFPAFGAITAVTLAPPLLIHPLYVLGFEGAALVTVVILPAAACTMLVRRADGAETMERRAITRVAGWMLVGAVVLAGVGLTISLAWGVYRAAAERQELAQAMSATPLEQIDAQGYRYARLFNELSLDDQMVIVTRLQGLTDRRVAVAVDAESAVTSYFRPVVAMRDHEQLHVIAWFGQDIPRSGLGGMGAATTFLRMCAACAALPSTYDNDLYRWREDLVDRTIQAVHDLSWENRYRMMSFPLPPDADDAAFLRVGILKITGTDGQGFYFTTVPLASARLEFGQ